MAGSTPPRLLHGRLGGVRRSGGGGRSCRRRGREVAEADEGAQGQGARLSANREVEVVAGSVQCTACMGSAMAGMTG